MSHQISFLRIKPSAEDVSSKRGADNINISCSKKPSAEMKDTAELACARNIKNGNSEDSVLRHKTDWAAQA